MGGWVLAASVTLAAGGGLIGIATAQTAGAAAAEKPAELVVRAATVITMDPARPTARAVAVRQGHIVYVGDEAGVEPFIGKGTRVLTCGPATGTAPAATPAQAKPGERSADAPCTVLPGLIDAHAHLVELGLSLGRLELRGLSSVADIVQAVRARASQAPRAERDAEAREAWILGQGWDQNRFAPPELPGMAERRALDAAAGARPVWLSRIDGHAGWASAEALRRAGITRDTPEVAGGHIVRDPAGEPTGVLIDNAMSLVERVVPQPSPAELEDAILAAGAHVTARGLTGVHEMSIGPDAATALRRLAEAGRLPLRVHGFLADPIPSALAQFPASMTYREQLDKLGERLGPPETGAQYQHMLSLRGIKLFIDGALGSRGAALDLPYSDDAQNSGLLLAPPEHIEAMARWAALHGYQIATHAIGDRGNHLVLNAYEAAGVREGRNLRFRIEHAQVLLPSDLQRRRFEELGVIASLQPTHATSDMGWAPARLGPARLAFAYPWQALLQSGARIAAGSDFPVEDPDPRLGLHAAVTRQDPQGQPAGGFTPSQRLSVGEAVRAFTTDAAYAAFAENYLGRVQVGYEADLTVLDGTLSLDASPAGPPTDLARRAVLMTVIAGRIAHAAGDWKSPDTAARKPAGKRATARRGGTSRL